MYLLNAGVVEVLPMDMFLGRDSPVLPELLESNTSTVNISCAVLTRAQAKAGLQPLPDLYDSLCEGGTKGPRKSSGYSRSSS